MIANAAENDRQLRKLFAPHGRGAVTAAMAIVWIGRASWVASAAIVASWFM